jgi:hypothetical protein
MRFRLRTLLIWATFGPPLLAAVWWILPHALPLAIVFYFGTVTLLFAVRWATICRDAEDAARQKLHNENSHSRLPDRRAN